MPNLQTLKASVINKIIIDSKLQQSGQLQENTVLQRLYTVMTNVETCYCFQIQNFISELFNTLTNTFPVLAAVINSQEDFNKLLSAFVLKVYARYQSNREYLSKLVLYEVRYIRFPRVLFINSINKSKSHVHEHIASIDQIFEFSKSSYILMAYITGLSIQNSMSIDYSYLNTVMTTQHISLLQRFHYFVIEIDKINPDIKAQTHLYRYGLNFLAWQDNAKLVLAGRFAQLKETSVSIRRAAQVDVTLLRHFLTNNIEIRQKQLAQLEIKKKKRFQQIIKAQQSESVLFTSLDGPQVKKLTNILLKYSDNKLFSMKTNYEVESSQKYLNLSKAIYDLKSIQNKFNMTFITHTNQKISLFESSQPHSFKFVKQRRKQVAQRLIVQVENNLIKKDYEVDLFLKSQNEKILDVIINQTLYEEMQFQQNVQGMMFQGFMLFCLVNKITVNVAQVLFFQNSLNIPVNSQQIVSYDYTSMSQQQLFRLVFFCKLIQPQNPGKISAIIQKSTFSYIQQLEILFQKIYAKFADVAKSKTDLKAIFAVFSDIFHTIWKHESTALSFFKKFQTKQNIVQKLYNGVFGQNLKGQVDSLDVPQAINIINQSLNRSDNQNNNQVFYDIDGLSHQKNTQNNYNTKVNPKVNATNGVVLYRNDYGISTPRITQDTYFTKVNPQVNVTNGTTGINPYYGPAPANVDPDSNKTIENKNLSFQKSADIDVHVRETQKNQKLSGKSKQQISRTRRVVSKILTKKSKRDAQLAYQYTQLRLGVSLKQKELSDKNQTLNLRNIVNNLYDKKSKLKQDLVHLSNKQKQNIENIENKQKQLLQLNKQLKKSNDNYEEEKATLQQFQKQVELYTRIRWQKPQNVPVLLIRVFQATNEVQRNKKISQMRQSISAKIFVSKSNGMTTLANIKTVEDKLTQLKLYRDVYKDQIQDQYKHAQAQVSLDINSYIKKGQILVKETLRQNVGLLQNSYEKDRQDNYFEIQKNMKDPKKIGQNKVVLEQYQYDQIANTLKLYENVFVKNMSLLEEYCQKSHNKLLMNQIREVKELYKRHYDIKKVLTLHQNPSLDKMSPKDLTYLQQLYKNLMDL